MDGPALSEAELKSTHNDIASTHGPRRGEGEGPRRTMSVEIELPKSSVRSGLQDHEIPQLAGGSDKLGTKTAESTDLTPGRVWLGRKVAAGVLRPACPARGAPGLDRAQMHAQQIREHSGGSGLREVEKGGVVGCARGRSRCRRRRASVAGWRWRPALCPG